MGTRGKINAIWWHIKLNLQKLVDICGYELPTNLENFTQKDLTENRSENIPKSFRGATFFETPCRLYFKLKKYTSHTWFILGLWKRCSATPCHLKRGRATPWTHKKGVATPRTCNQSLSRSPIQFLGVTMQHYCATFFVPLTDAVQQFW